MAQEQDKWYWKSDLGYEAFDPLTSQRICAAKKNVEIDFIVTDGDKKIKFTVIKTSKNCAWQKNTFTNRVRPVIRNIDEIKDETEILNRRDSANPFSASQKDQQKFLGQEYQRFGEIFPGTYPSTY